MEGDFVLHCKLHVNEIWVSKAIRKECELVGVPSISHLKAFLEHHATLNSLRTGDQEGLATCRMPSPAYSACLDSTSKIKPFCLGSLLYLTKRWVNLVWQQHPGESVRTCSKWKESQKPWLVTYNRSNWNKESKTKRRVWTEILALWFLLTTHSSDFCTKLATTSGPKSKPFYKVDYFAVISSRISKDKPFWLVSQREQQSFKSQTQYLSSVKQEFTAQAGEFRDKACACHFALPHHTVCSSLNPNPAPCKLLYDNAQR